MRLWFPEGGVDSVLIFEIVAEQWGYCHHEAENVL